MGQNKKSNKHTRLVDILLGGLVDLVVGLIILLIDKIT